MPPYEQLAHIKRLRETYKKLEKELKDMLELGDIETFRHAELALTETESARHWLGECLGDLGVEYKHKEEK
ncbi:MAG TPA: hypothetical protein ENI23_11420 [bacterium]|nr:hypothetical protein [bacterium]